jgi:hypothetical protein
LGYFQTTDFMDFSRATKTIAQQQKWLAIDWKFRNNTYALGAFTGVGAHPPKPPPLVGYLAQPLGVALFFGGAAPAGAPQFRLGFQPEGACERRWCNAIYDAFLSAYLQMP